MKTRSLLCVVGTALSAAGVPALGQATPLAITNARILVMPGDASQGGGIGEIERGTLIVKDGKIQAVGKDVPVPAGATVIDAAGKVVMPGLVDTHSHVGGIGGADGSGPIQPEVRVYDSLNIRDSGYRRVVAGGITTLNVMPGSGHLLSGQTVYLKLRTGATKVDDWFYKDADGRPAGGMKMANGTNSIRESPFPGTRGKSASLVREQFVKAQEYAAKAERASKAGKDGKPDPEKMPERNLALEGLNEVIGGKKIVQHHTHRADDILTVLRIADEFKTRIVLHHVSEAWKVANEIAAADTGWGKKGIKGTPCSVIVIDTPGGKLEAAEASWETGAMLEKAGVTVVFHTDDWITDSRLFNRSAALAHRAGMSRAGALRALTINGAKLLDLETKVGSLEVGKDADFIILSGDPLSVYTKVEQTFVEGVKVFDRADPKDRLFAVGGFGAGNDQSPYLCCAGGSVFSFGGREWSSGGDE
ncbi:MAG: amidohydrolase family protein [Phycisphaerales bacterium]